MVIFLSLIGLHWLGLAQAYGASLTSVNQELSTLQKLRSSEQVILDELIAAERSLTQSINKQSIMIKRFSLRQRSLSILAKNDPDAQSEIDTLNYKERVAEISIDKSKHKLSRNLEAQEQQTISITLLNKKIEALSIEKQAIVEWRAKQQAKKKKTKTKAKPKTKANTPTAPIANTQITPAPEAPTTPNADNSNDTKPSSPPSPQVAKFIESKGFEDLPPYQQALEKTEYIAALSDKPPSHFSISPTLARSKNKQSSKLKTANIIGTMVHLGNDQYKIEFTLRKGHQTFFINEQSFPRFIAPAFDKRMAIALLDARSEQSPVLIIIPKD